MPRVGSPAHSLMQSLHAVRRVAARGGLLALALLACAAGLARPAHALFREDFEQAYFVDPRHTVADHCMIKRGDVWHMFYTMGPYGTASAVLQDTLGHATTTDFIHWTVQPGILPVQPGAWDANAHWAPEIVNFADTLYYMFYTGVDMTNTQRIGVATSHDLFTWTPYAGNPVFQPDTTWTNWRPGQWADCRDPSLWQVGSTWYMAYTAASTYGKGSIGYASSTDLLHWTDRGALLIHPSGPTSSYALESPLMLQHNGQWSLSFTEANVSGIAAMTASNFSGPWNYNARVIVDRGAALAASTDPANGRTWFSRHRAETVNDTTRFFVKIDTLTWNGTLPVPRFAQPFPRWTWNGLAFIEQSTFLDSRVKSRPAVQQEAFGWMGTAEGWQGPLQLGTPGQALGDTITGVAQTKVFALTGDSLTALVAGGDNPDSTALRVCDPCTGRVLHSESGQRTDLLERRTWATGALRGQQVYIQMMDWARGPWGHLNVDDIREVLAPGGDSTPVALAAPVVDAPTTGQSFELGVLDTLRWHPSVPAALDSTHVLLSRDGGLTFPERLATIAGGDSLLAWTPDGTTTSTAQLRLIFWHTGGRTSCNVSPAFTLCSSGISHVFPANLTATTASVFWTTTTPTIGVIDYGPGLAPTLTATEVTAAPRTVHHVPLTGLTPATLYSVRVRGCGTATAQRGPLFEFRTAAGDSAVPSYVVLGDLPRNDTLHTNYVAVLAWVRRGEVASTPVGLLTPTDVTWAMELAGALDPFTGWPLAPAVGDSVTVAVLEGGTLNGWWSANALDGAPPQWITTPPVVTAVGEPSGAERNAWLRVAPQPAQAGHAIHLRLRDAGRSPRLAVYDIAGRRVRDLAVPDGAREIAWDGRDDAGHVLAPGVYHVVPVGRPARDGARVLILR